MSGNPFNRAVDACFEHLGVAAVYTPDGGPPKDIRVIAKRADEIVGVGGKRINPSNFPEHRFGPLRFVYRRGRPSLLVVDAVRVNARTGRVGRRAKGGAFTKTGRMKAGMSTVAMFFMVPQVRLPKRLDVRRAAERWSRRLPRLIGRHMQSE